MNRGRRGGIASGFSVVLLSGVGSSLLSSLAIILVIRALAPEEWGQAAVLMSVGQLLGAVLSFGTPIERIRRYARTEPGILPEVATLDALVRIGTGAVVLLIGIATVPFSADASSVLLAAAGTYVSLGAPNHLVGARRFLAAGTVTLAEKGILLGSVLVAIATGRVMVTTLPALIGMAGLLAGVLSLLWLRPRWRSLPLRQSLAAMPRQWAQSFDRGVASLAPSMLLLDVTIVLLVAGQVQAGIFGVATKLTSPLTVAASAIASVLLPYYSRGTVPTARIGRASVVGTIGAMSAALLLIATTATWWVPAVFGAAYEAASTPVCLYVLNAGFVFVTRAAAATLQAWNDDKFVARAILVQCLTALVGIALGAHWAAATGAAMSLVSTNLFLSLVLLRRVLRVRSTHS